MSNERTTQFVTPVTSPRYDDIYYEGLEWLNGLDDFSLKRQVTFDQLIKKEKQYLKNWKR